MKKQTIRGIIIVIIAFLLGIRVLNYSGNNNQSSTSNDTAVNQPVQKQKIVLADIGWAGAAPLYVAQEKNLFGPSIEVDIKKLPNMGDHRIGINAGSIDIYQGTHDMLLSTDGGDLPGKIFMAGDESYGGDGLLVQEGVNSINDLVGKTVALEEGTPAYMLFQYAAKKEGLSLDDFDIKYIPIPDGVTAFIGGNVDAAGAWEPYISNAIKERPGAKALHTSREYPGLFPGLYAARPGLFDTPEVLIDFMKGWFNALDYIESNGDEAYEIMGEAYEMSAQDMRDLKLDIIWHDEESMKKLFDKNIENNVYENFEEVKSVMKFNNTVPAPNSAESVIDSSIVTNY